MQGSRIPPHSELRILNLGFKGQALSWNPLTPPGYHTHTEIFLLHKNRLKYQQDTTNRENMIEGSVGGNWGPCSVKIHCNLNTGTQTAPPVDDGWENNYRFFFFTNHYLFCVSP